MKGLFSGSLITTNPLFGFSYININGHYHLKKYIQKDGVGVMKNNSTTLHLVRVAIYNGITWSVNA